MDMIKLIIKSVLFYDYSYKKHLVCLFDNVNIFDAINKIQHTLPIVPLVHSIVNNTVVYIALFTGT